MTRLRSILAVVLAMLVFAGGCSTGSSAKMNVVTSTTLLYCIVRQVGGDKVNAVNLVPATQHPGNFDYKPSDVQTLANGKLFILHGWPGEGYASRIIAAANNPDLKAVNATADGNWMIPPVQLAATDKVAQVLGEADKANAAAYKAAAEAYKQRIQVKEGEIKVRLPKENASQVAVIASVRQADFLQWAGFNVVGTYAEPVSLTPQAVKELVDKGKAAKATLVVDNLQSGKDAGKGLAEELGAKQLNLSNFPGGFENSDTWEKAIDKNVDLLLAAMGK